MSYLLLDSVYTSELLEDVINLKLLRHVVNLQIFSLQSAQYLS